MKHFVGNEQEFERFSSDSVIPDRALREIYLEPFRIAEHEAKPKCYMTSYNRVNGVHCSESKWLLDDILRKEWGFEGMVMSDWTGVYSCDTSKSCITKCSGIRLTYLRASLGIKAGLDIEMPGPPVFRGAQVLRQLQAGKLFMWEIDERVRKILGIVKFAKQSGIPFGVEEKMIDNDETRALLRKAAANAIVLLKNEKDILPIKEAKKIAVIGSNARVACPSGGGSASMLTAYTVTPLEGITAAAKEIGAAVEYSIGSATYLYMPAISKMLRHPNGKSEAGFAQVDFWKSEPTKDFTRKDAGIRISQKADYSVSTATCNCFMMDGVPSDITVSKPYIRVSENKHACRCSFFSLISSFFQQSIRPSSRLTRAAHGSSVSAPSARQTCISTVVWLSITAPTGVRETCTSDVGPKNGPVLSTTLKPAKFMIWKFVLGTKRTCGEVPFKLPAPSDLARFPLSRMKKRLLMR